MFDDSSDSRGGMNWGIIIFFLILFWFWGGNNGFGRGDRAYAGHNECVPMDNLNELKDLQCTIGRNDAVLQSQLDTAFRTVINNDNVNTARILEGQKDLYIKQLERENTQLFVVGENEKTRTQSLLLKADTDAKLADISCNMLKRPPVYPTVCVPCAQPFPSCGAM